MTMANRLASRYAQREPGLQVLSGLFQANQLPLA